MGVTKDINPTAKIVISKAPQADGEYSTYDGVDRGHGQNSSYRDVCVPTQSLLNEDRTGIHIYLSYQTRNHDIMQKHTTLYMLYHLSKCRGQEVDLIRCLEILMMFRNG